MNADAHHLLSQFRPYHNNEQDAVPAIIHEKNVAASDIHILRNQPKVLAYATPALRIK
jgi:hypothetical protein